MKFEGLGGDAAPEARGGAPVEPAGRQPHASSKTASPTATRPGRTVEP